MAWTETPSETFVARHDERDAPDVERVLLGLEHARDRLEALFPARVGELAVVLHGSSGQLDAAQPWLPLQRALTAPAARRYLVGCATESELHVLSPRLLAHRASNVEGSLEMLMLAPAALFARRLIAAVNPGLPPPLGPRPLRRWLRWAWLVEGAAQHFSGQARHIRPAVTRRLREGGTPSFPPAARDATLLGGTVFGVLAGEHGERACIELAGMTPCRDPSAALRAAFSGRPVRHTEQAWRRELDRLAAAPATTASAAGA